MRGDGSVNLCDQSNICSSSAMNVTYGSCSYRLSASKGTAVSTAGHACCKTAVIYQLLTNYHSEYSEYVNGEYLLGLSYAAYNFTQKYDLGHSFTILPAKPSECCLGGFDIITTNYPFPYNTTYIKSLDLLNKFISKPAYNYENGGAISQASVYLDTLVCGRKVGSNAGQFLASAGGGATQYFPKYLKNSMFFQGYC